jgi:hypothetical protein
MIPSIINYCRCPCKINIITSIKISKTHTVSSLGYLPITIRTTTCNTPKNNISFCNVSKSSPTIHRKICTTPIPIGRISPTNIISSTVKISTTPTKLFLVYISKNMSSYSSIPVRYISIIWKYLFIIITIHM